MLRRLIRIGLAAFALAIVLALASFALPVRSWRTGQEDWRPMALTASDRWALLPRRVWIDTDAACGLGSWHDPDDCLALLALLTRTDLQVVGISTVFGNAPLEATDAVARELAARLAPVVGRRIPVFRGCAAALPRCPGGEEAHAALRATLKVGPLTILALGPPTNIAAALGSDSAALEHDVHVVAVMGRRPGHRFHPTEGRSNFAMLFGHGPVFRDLNFVLDPQAAAALLRARIALTLVPYEAARNVLLTKSDLDRIASRDAAGAWVAERSRPWLDRWRLSIGLDGFYPFDIVAAMYLVAPERFGCARVRAWVGRDPKLTIFERAPALLVSQDEVSSEGAAAANSAVYCVDVDLGAADMLPAREIGRVQGG